MNERSKLATEMGLHVDRDMKVSPLLRDIMSRQADEFADCAVATSTVPQPETKVTYASIEAMAASVKATMDRLRANDPIALYFKAKGVNIDTHDVFLHTSLKEVWANPPAYVYFTDMVEPAQMLTVERMSMKDYLPLNPLRDV